MRFKEMVDLFKEGCKKFGGKYELRKKNNYYRKPHHVCYFDPAEEGAGERYRKFVSWFYANLSKKPFEEEGVFAKGCYMAEYKSSDATLCDGMWVYLG